MMEFMLSRNGNGKKSRWGKKYPRKRILKRGDEKAARWYWYGYHYFHGDLHKFLIKNVGRPVDKVFSKFLQRCDKNTRKYSLREKFYSVFEEKKNISCNGGFYLSNGIINYKKKSGCTHDYYTTDTYRDNVNRMPTTFDLEILCMRAKKEYNKILVGTFHTRTSYFGKVREVKVYIVTRELFYKKYFFNTPVEILYYGYGFEFKEESTQYKNITYTEFFKITMKDKVIRCIPEFVFIANL